MDMKAMVVAVTLAVPSLAGAQVPGSLPGRVLPMEAYFGGLYSEELPASARREIQGQFAAVMKVFERAPALNPPRGLEVRPDISFIDVHAPYDDEPSQPLPAMLWLPMYPYRSECAGCPPKAGPRWSNALFVIANSPHALRANWRAGRIRAGGEEFYIEPRITGSVAGHPVYAGSVVMLTKRTAPVFVPVTREQWMVAQLKEQRLMHEKAKAHTAANTGANSPYQKWRREKPERDAANEAALQSLKGILPADSIARMRATLAQVEAETEKTLRKLEGDQPAQSDELGAKILQNIEALETLLSRMTPAERQQAARYCPNNVAEAALCRAGSEDGQRLVQVNPEFFEPSLPRTAFQLLAVTYDRNLDVDAVSGAVIRRLWDTLNWDELRALLH